MKVDNTTGPNKMKLPELADRASVSNSTVYDYLRSGLLQQPQKQSPTKSFFTREHLERLQEIRNLREQGFSISDIKDYYGQNLEGDASIDLYESVKIEIIDKALELFSIYHYDKTKISDITKALNIGSGTFYRYFQSKEELFLGCLQRLPIVLVPTDAWQEVEEETDFILRLKKRGYAMLNAFPSYIGILNYAKQALGGGDDVLAAKAAECIKTLISPLQKDLEMAIKLGLVRHTIDVEMCAYLLLGINETFGYRTLIEPDYSVDHGFSVIGDFIKHALTVGVDETDQSTPAVFVTDNQNKAVELASLTFNGHDFICGDYMSGELKIPLNKIKRIELSECEGSLCAGVSCQNQKHVDILINPNDSFSGNASVGFFSISAKRIMSIDF